MVIGAKWKEWCSGGIFLKKTTSVKADAVRIGHYNDGQFPTNAKEFTKRIFYTVFINEASSSSKKHSRVVAEDIGSWHLDVAIDGVVSALLSLFQTLIIPKKHHCRSRIVWRWILERKLASSDVPNDEQITVPEVHKLMKLAMSCDYMQVKEDTKDSSSRGFVELGADYGMLELINGPHVVDVLRSYFEFHLEDKVVLNGP
ncbi:hypothetical protein SASPL_114366 [Salvia splendens]|uniref:Uncharacterized protein n=1 Tax=Salvia splendens TaxID=180675 RepID=A0A8X9A0M4_SALSN|nr:hypothetical protein SASPL_114366 [Salvia splendens]